MIDKDLTAALLAESLDAGRLLMLTDVPFVERDWGTSAARPIASATPNERAASSSTRGRRAAIGALGDLASVARGDAGTQITPVRLHAVA